MSKPKDHLFYRDDVVRSVLLGHTVKSQCAGWSATLAAKTWRTRNISTRARSAWLAPGRMPPTVRTLSASTRRPVGWQWWNGHGSGWVIDYMPGAE